MNEFILFTAGFLAAFIGSMAGGGAGMIQFASLLYVGLPINSAVATNMFGNLGFYPPTFRNFKHAHLLKRRALPELVVLTLISSAIGTLFVINLDGDILSKAIIAGLILALLVLLIEKDAPSKERKPKKGWRAAYFVFNAGGAAGMGTNALSTLVLIYVRGFTALQAAANRFFAHGVGSTLAVGILLFSDLIDYQYGAILFMANIIGAHFGSKIAIREGNNFVRLMLMLVTAGVIVQLLFLTEI